MISLCEAIGAIIYVTPSSMYQFIEIVECTPIGLRNLGIAEWDLILTLEESLPPSMASMASADNGLPLKYLTLCQLCQVHRRG